MRVERSQPVPGAPSPLGRIFLAVGVLGLIGTTAWSLADDAAGHRFVQVGVALGALVYLATFIDILLGLAFLIICIAFSPEVAFGGLDQFRLEDFIVPALLLGWLARAGKDRERFQPFRIGGSAALYFGVMALSTLAGLTMSTTTPLRALTTLGKYIEYFVLYLVVLHNVRTAAEFRALVAVSVATACAAGLMSSTGLLAAGGEDRAHGPAGETANIFGGYLVLHLAMTVGLLLHSVGTGARFWALVAAACLAWGISKTYSRTSYSALAGALCAFALLRERRVLALLAAGFLLGPLILPSAVTNRIADIGNVATGSGPSSWQSRVYSWEATFQRLAGFDFAWGRGLGSVDLGYVDNEYIRVLADTGIAGLACFLALLWRFARHADRAYQVLPPGGFHKGAAAGFWIAMAAMAVHAIGATSFTSIRTMEAFMVLAGLAMVQANRMGEWGLLPEAAPPPKRPLAGTPPGPLPLVLLPSPPPPGR